MPLPLEGGRRSPQGLSFLVRKLLVVSRASDGLPSFTVLFDREDSTAKTVDHQATLPPTPRFAMSAEGAIA